MSREIRAEVDLDCTADAVWSVLTNFSEYTSWNPFIVSAAGRAELGASVEVIIAVPEGRRLKFQPRIFRVASGKRLAWSTGMFIPGLFDRDVSFDIEELDGGRVRFVHQATLSGVLVPFRRRAVRDLETGYAVMNEALRRRVATVAASRPVAPGEAVAP